MERGRVEYSPDYKSRIKKTADRYRSFLEATKMNVVDYQPKADVAERCKERARLEREVIEAAKRVRQNDLAITRYWERRASDAGYDPASAALFTLINNSGGKAFNAAVDALLKFEAQQK